MGKKYIAGVTHKTGSKGTIKQKISWNQLGMVFGGHLGMAPEEAAQVLTEHLFKDRSWKGDYKNPLGRMWQDQEVVKAFCIALADRDKLIKKYGIMKATSYMFYHSQSFQMFLIYANVRYVRDKFGLKKFQNDFAVWKKLPFLKKKFAKSNKLKPIADKKLRAKTEKMIDDWDSYNEKMLKTHENTPFGWRRKI